MKDGKKIIWIIDGEWTDHKIEEETFIKKGYELKVTHPDDLEKDLPLYAPYADGIAIQISFDCNEAFLNHLESCKVICVYGVGFNNINLEAAGRKEIAVYNVPDYCVDEVSDHTIALLFSVGRRLKSYNLKVEQGKWDALDTLPIYRFKDMTIGLLGFGRIARSVAIKMKATGANIIAHDKYADENAFKNLGVVPVSFEELLAQSNMLSLHVPLTKETENLLDYDCMMKMQKGAMIVNTCRGGIINEEDLALLIELGHISGAGIDVFTEEPIPADHPLLNKAEVIITPHSSYVSVSSFHELKTRVCQIIENGINGIPQPNMVNKQYVNQ
ncbi:C-terminal binding protein [Bacillus sp. JJ1521]|uniref:C-terminal binding protein n=1 Tax=Bacillus sp. JJ1521 TaxID=3122957 RepID=UPI002FFDE188